MVTAAAPWRKLLACAVLGTNIPETHNFFTSFLWPNACEIQATLMAKDAKGSVGAGGGGRMESPALADTQGWEKHIKKISKTRN